jgi:hypothetical protein
MKTPSRTRPFAAWLAGMVVVVGHLPLAAAEVDIPYTFSPGRPAIAAEVNANFAALDAAVDDNAARVLALESAAATDRQVFSLRLVRDFAGFGLDYTVPADRVLVIESISVSAWIAANLEHDYARLRIRPGNLAPGTPINEDLEVPILLTAAGRVDFTAFPNTGRVDFRTGVGSLTTRLYARPGREVLLSIPSVTGWPDEASGVISVSGYLLPSDSPSLAP